MITVRTSHLAVVVAAPSFTQVKCGKVSIYLSENKKILGAERNGGTKDFRLLLVRFLHAETVFTLRNIVSFFSETFQGELIIIRFH